MYKYFKSRNLKLCWNFNHLKFFINLFLQEYKFIIMKVTDEINEKLDENKLKTFNKNKISVLFHAIPYYVKNLNYLKFLAKSSYNYILIL